METEALFVKECYFLCIVLTSVDELLNYLREHYWTTFTAISFSVSVELEIQETNY